MTSFMLLLCGMLMIIAGSIVWWTQEPKRRLRNVYIYSAMFGILLGAFVMLQGLAEYIDQVSHIDKRPLISVVGALDWLFVILLIYIGTAAYTLAAYYHLHLKDWSFVMALLIAIPFLIIEYQFSIRGNHSASHILGLNVLQITLITMCFYFINSWILNVLVLKNKVVWWREISAFILVIFAFVISTQRSV